MLFQKAARIAPRYISTRASSGFFSTSALPDKQLEGNQWLTFAGKNSMLRHTANLNKVVLFKAPKTKCAAENGYQLYPECPEIQVGIVRQHLESHANSVHKIHPLFSTKNNVAEPICIDNPLAPVVLHIRQPTSKELAKILKAVEKAFATQESYWESYDRLNEDLSDALNKGSDNQLKLLEEWTRIHKQEEAEPYMLAYDNGYPHDLISMLKVQLLELKEDNIHSSQFKPK